MSFLYCLDLETKCTQCRGSHPRPLSLEADGYNVFIDKGQDSGQNWSNIHHVKMHNYTKLRTGILDIYT